MPTPCIIAPSVLSADFANLGRDVRSVIQAGAELIHFDVMDNHFVPNLSIGPMVCQALINDGITTPIDVHLMVEPVDSLIHAFAKAGASYITFHPQATQDVNQSLEIIHRYGLKAGLALNPDTPESEVLPYLEKLDLILVMSVFPGFGGQAFIPEVLTKIKTLRKAIDQHHKSVLLSVDGGINEQTIIDVAKAGANVFVAGSAIFKHADHKNAIMQLQQTFQQVIK